MGRHDRQQADEAHGEVPAILSANGKTHVSDATYRQNRYKHISSAPEAPYKAANHRVGIRVLREIAASPL
jgi:hypothetical protein